MSDPRQTAPHQMSHERLAVTGIPALWQSIARLCQTDIGNELVQNAKPFDDWHTAQGWSVLVQRQITLDRTPPSFDLRANLYEAIHCLDEREILDLEQLAALRHLLRTLKRCQRWGAEFSTMEQYLPSLGPALLIAEGSDGEDAVEQRNDQAGLALLNHHLDDHNQLVAHDGSKLAELRLKFEDLAHDIRQSAKAMLIKPPWQELAVQRQPVLHNNRICLMLRGMPPRRKVHIAGRSRSGGTFYVEDRELHSRNNRLADLGEDVATEEYRELATISQRLYALQIPWQTILQHIAMIDRFCAEADFLRRVLGRDCSFPQQNDDALQGQWHNLLLRATLGKEAKPLDLQLCRSQPMLISGPNAGGKTGLLTALAQIQSCLRRGLPVATDPAACAPWPGALYFDGGDQQDLQAGESSYSAHVRYLSACLKQVQPSDWLLVDELGGKTDPDEGAAIAIAWLEEICTRSDWLIISSHNSTVKRWCAEQSWQLGALGFNHETLQPEYRVRWGFLGESEARGMAMRTGFPAHLVQRAEDLYASLFSQEHQLHGMHQLLTDAENRIKDLAVKERDLETKIRNLAIDAKSDFQRKWLHTLQQKAEDAEHKLRSAGSIKGIRRLVRTEEQKIQDDPPEEKIEKENPSHTQQSLKQNTGLENAAAGDRVEHRGWKRQGMIVEVSGSQATVHFDNGISVTCPLTELKSAAKQRTSTTSFAPADPQTSSQSSTQKGEITVDLRNTTNTDGVELLSRAWDQLVANHSVTQIRVFGRNPEKLSALMAPITREYGERAMIRRSVEGPELLISRSSGTAD